MRETDDSVNLTVRLIQALEEYTLIRKSHDDQRDQSSYGWGYYGQEIRDKLEAKEKSVHEALSAVIRSVVSDMGK